MKKLTDQDPETKSADVLVENVAHLRTLFPEAFTEGKVDFEVLKQLLGGVVEERDEKYGLNWHGKRRARQLALTPSTGTLRPCPEESVDWDTTQNVMIEGDNLEVLKLLQKSYAGKVKLIYIDPPYNRGKDFVYKDDYQDNIKNYLMLTGQIDSDGRKLSTSAEASGRFHTDWLNMMYPRLKLARNLLRKDGVVLISIDDGEVSNLRYLCDELFGQENFVAQLVWEGANKNDARQIGVCHEYVVAYASSRQDLPSEWRVAKEGVKEVLEEVARLRTQYGSDCEAASKDLAGWFRAMKATPSFAHRRFHNIDERGAYKEDDPTAPGGRRFELRDPRSGKVIPLRANRGWGFDQQEFERLIEEGRISFISETSVMVRRYLHETDESTPQSVFYQPARSASERLTRLMGDDVFDYPKDDLVLQKFVEMAADASDPSAIIVDFFAGSGTTGHAVLAQNAVDGSSRRYVLVQLPEPLGRQKADPKTAADSCDKVKEPRTIAELTKERLRHAGKKVKEENRMFAGDVGFRVFKLASSNIRAWEPDRANVAESLADAVEHLKADRTEADVLCELLLKLGLDLCVPIERRTIAGKDVHAVGGGVLLACLPEALTRDEVEPLALGIAEWHTTLAPAGDTTCVFRDSAFVDDVAKANLAAILEQHGLTNVRSL